MKRNDGWKKTQTILITTIILFMSLSSIFNWDIVSAEKTPATPINFTATASNRTAINLSWVNDETNNTYIEWNTTAEWDRGKGNFIQNCSTNTTYNHTGLNSGTMHYYRAWTYNLSNNLWSAYVTSTATTDYSIPEPPTNFNAATHNRTQIDLTWTKGVNATHTLIEWNETETWSRGEGNDIYNDTESSFSHTDLEHNITYYYQAWTYNLSNNTWSADAHLSNTTFSNQIPVFSNENPENRSTGQGINFIWNLTIQDPEGDTFNWSIECSDGESNNANDDTNGSKNLNLSNLDYDTEYTIWVNATDEYGAGTREWFTFTTRKDPQPFSSNVRPQNRSVSVEVDITQWSVNITDNDGDTTNGKIHCSNGDTTNWNEQANGTRLLNLSTLEYNTNYTVWLNFTDGQYNINEIYWFKTREKDIPSSPSALNANPIDRSQINVSWTKGAKADYTYIEYNVTSSWDRGMGILIQNCSSNTSFYHTSLDIDTMYYYQAWSYNQTDNVWSMTYAFINATTLGNQLPVASFAYEPLYPEVGETVWFNDTSTDKDGYITNWTWTFQDGSNNYSQNTTYLFSELINKNVTLTVVDNDGNTSSVKKEIILKKTYTEHITSTTIYSFDLSSEANTKIVIKTSNTTNLSVTKYSDIPFGITETISGYENLKTYVDVSLENEALLDWINLSLYYTSEDLSDDINLSSLTLFYWNETSDAWVKISDSIPSSSDVSNYHGFVQTNITHLTLFTIAGTIAEEEETIDPTLPNIVNSSNNTIFTIPTPTLNITYDEIVPEITASLNGTTIQVATTDNKTFTLFIHTALTTGNYTLKVQLKNESLSRTDLIYFSINIPPPVQKQETPIEIPLWVWYGILIVLGGAIIYFTGMLNHLYNYLIKQKQQSTNEGISASKPKSSHGFLKDTISSVQHSMGSFDAVVFGSNDPWKHAQESVNHTLYNIDLFTEKPDAYVGIQEKLITEEPTCKDIINLLEHDDVSIEDIKEKTDLSKEELSKELSILLKYGLIEEQDTNMFQLTKQARQLVKGTVG